MTSKQKFELAAIEHIEKNWVKRSQRGVRGILKGHGTQYPSRVTNYVWCDVDGKLQLFKVEIRPAVPPDSTANEVLK